MALTSALRPLSLAAAVVVVAALAALLSPAGVPEAEAHATLVRSSPENGAQELRPPLRVVLYFSEPVEPRLTDIEVFDKDRNQVDEGDVQVNPDDRTQASVGVQDLAPGLYTVEFSNVSSVDGHPWNGLIQFIVRNPDGSVPPDAVFDPEAGQGAAGGTGLLPKPVDVALKWLSLVALSVVAGAAFWVLAVARPAANFLEEEPYQAAVDHAERWLVRAAHILLPAAFVSMALLVLVTISRFEVTTSIWEYLTEIRTGQYRLTLSVLIIAALAGADVFFLARSRLLREGGLLVLLAASCGGLLTFSLTSHGGAGDGAFWAVTSDYIHLIGSAVWLGALTMLVPFTVWVRRALEPPERLLYVANVFDRFSIVAGISVMVILATGAFNGFAEIPNPKAMVDTTYGRVLIVKLALMMPLLIVAGVNALYLKPRLVAAIDGLHQQGGGLPAAERAVAEARLGWVQRVLPRTIVVEVALLIAVFVSVAVLTQTSTAEGEIAQEQAAQAASTSFRDEKAEADLILTLDVRPNRVGINQYDLFVRNSADGTPATDITQARLRFFYTDPTNPDVAPTQTELILQRRGDGEYSGQGAYFSQPGSWRIETNIRRESVDDVTRNFVVPVAPPEAQASAGEGDRWDLPFTVFTWNEVLGTLLVLLGAGAVIYRKQFRVLGQWSGRVALSLAAFLVVGGGVLFFSRDSHSDGGASAAANPIEPTQASVERGRMLFQQNCIVCHGPEGRGDGPRAAELDPAPTDFRLHMPLHTDPQFYAFIANGYPGSAMPAWRDQFSEDDIWNLVNFLRAEFSEPVE